MKLLVDCSPLSVGGGLQVAVGLLVNLRNQSDIEWVAVVPDFIRPRLPPELAEDGRLHWVFKRSSTDRIWLSLHLAKLERDVAPDVVFTVFGPQYFRARAPHVVGFALPHLIYNRDPDMPGLGPLGRARNAMQRAILRQAHWFVVETNTAADRLATRLGIDPARIFVVPNSPNPLLVKRLDPAVKVGAPLGVLTPAAYYAHKNLEIIPDIAAAARRMRPDLRFDFRLTLPDNRSGWARIAAKAARLGLSERVRTLGVLKITQLADAYNEAFAVLLPTRREVSSAVYPESFFFRRPLVTSDVDFAHDLCGDGALFAPPLNAEQFARALISLADAPEYRERLISAGDHQLRHGYPTAAEKFRLQLEMLSRVAAGARAPRQTWVQTETSPTVPAPVSERLASTAAPSARPPKVVAYESTTAAVRFHDSVAEGWDDKYGIGGFRQRIEFFLRRVLPTDLNGGHWLDAGCGSGTFSRVFAERGVSVTGVDGSAKMVAQAGRLAASAGLTDLLRFNVIESVESLPFADDSFNGALCLSVLEYVDRPFDALDELARVVAPGGMLILSVPHARSPVRRVQHVMMRAAHDIMPQRWAYEALSRFLVTPHQLSAALSLRGFALRSLSGFDPILPRPTLSLLPPSLIFAVAVKQSTSVTAVKQGDT